MKCILSWCGFLLFISATIWLFFNLEQARQLRPVLDILFGILFYGSVMAFCAYCCVQGSVNLLKHFKELKKLKKIKDRIWDIFFILFDILLVLIMAGVAMGSLIMLYDHLKALFQ